MASVEMALLEGGARSMASVDDLELSCMFGIRCQIVETATDRLVAKKGLKGSPSWRLCIGKHDSATFARTFTSIIDYKQTALDALERYEDEIHERHYSDVMLWMDRPAECISR
jgi:hypothetical protein